MIKFPVLSYGLVGDFLFWYLITVIFHIFLAKNFLLYYLMVEGGGVSGGEGLYIKHYIFTNWDIAWAAEGQDTGERGLLWICDTSWRHDVETQRRRDCTAVTVQTFASYHTSYSTDIRYNDECSMFSLALLYLGFIGLVYQNINPFVRWGKYQPNQAI